MYWGSSNLIIHIPYPMRASKSMPVSYRNVGLHESQRKTDLQTTIGHKISYQPRQSAEAKRV